MNLARLAVITVVFLWTGPVGAGDNGEEVQASLKQRFQKVFIGPELKHDDYLKAIETNGASLSEYAEKVTDWAKTVGVQLTVDVVYQIIVTGRIDQNITGGIAAINHWTIESAPFIEFQGLQSRTGLRDVRVPLPNTFFPWVGFGVGPNIGGAQPAARDPQGIDPGRAVALIQSDFGGNLEVIALAQDVLYHYYRDTTTGKWLGGTPVVVGAGGLPGFIQTRDRNFQLIVPSISKGFKHYFVLPQLEMESASGWVSIT
jgi:hypothetical protein